MNPREFAGALRREMLFQAKQTTAVTVGTVESVDEQGRAVVNLDEGGQVTLRLPYGYTPGAGKRIDISRLSRNVMGAIGPSVY